MPSTYDRLLDAVRNTGVTLDQTYKAGFLVFTIGWIVIVVVYATRPSSLPPSVEVRFEAARYVNDSRSGPHVMSFEEVLVDTKKAFYKAAGKFVVPEEGVYSFTFMGAATATEVSFALVCVADKAHKKKTLTRVSWRQSKTTNGTAPLFGTVAAKLNVDDQIFLQQESLEGFVFERNKTTPVVFRGYKIA